ncbi:hypothetical protein Prudu_022518 [Prunus dulcis]|uniref:Uncharacterized protein n=1 Tax=Prunus dulcis TaxID=3755 RepID=A0A4Y1S1I5_PRUDU|nr:hypothetical protein L3X38_044417 [Prunus dulcis]BBH09883.1 hypothetical protein Prudu_022518 [Prunus dulcis]
MVQQTIDSKFSEYGMGATESELPVHDKQLSVPVKKTALRDLQNDIRVAMPNSFGSPPLLKDGGPISNAPRVSGTKRPLPEPECPMSLPQHQLPSSSAANGHLVYVRRKSEADVVRSSTCDNASINADCQVSRTLSHHEASTRPSHHETSTRPSHQEASARPIFQTKESKVYCIPAFAPFPMSASTIQPGKPSVSAPHCKSGIRIAPSGSNPLASATQTLAGSKGLRNLHWEERCHQLQLLLRKLDQSEQEDYLHMLRSLSSVDLSRHAVELEKRSIQLSLEEAKELQCVGFLNVLGKPAKQFKVPSTHQDRSDK